MSALKAIFGWIFRNALLFALIVAALIAHTVWVQNRSDEKSQADAARQELASLDKTSTRAAALRVDLFDEAERTRSELSRFATDTQGATVAELRAQRKEARAERQRLEQQLPSSFEEARQIAMVDLDAIARTASTKLQIAKLDRQIVFLDDSIAIASGNASVENAISALQTELAAARNAVSLTKSRCDDATEALEEFNGFWFGKKWWRGGRREREGLELTKKLECDAHAAAKSTRDAINDSISSAREALNTGEAVIDESVTAATAALDELERQTDERKQQIATLFAEGEDAVERFAERYEVFRQARDALIILLGIIAMPFLIRTLFYYVIAPLAERRPSIRIAVPGSAGSPDPLADPSHVSIPVELDDGEELLIRQDYLQTSSVSGEKATQWLLDYRHPVSSIAAGLSFLTRIRGQSTTTVSAVKDAFAELAEITLPAGSSCVLQPRALVAVVQPTGQPMPITSHWRLFSLNAWLTMQLRFFVFHGPGRLIVKGGRGVRVESAEAGRIFGQDQLVGFSADLAYSVTRTETFAPYLFGREQLFKDKVQESTGVLIIEEAPLAGRPKGEVRRGLEGAFDAGMKAFGL